MRLRNRGGSIKEESTVPEKNSGWSDIKYVTKHTRWLLTILGLWPAVTSDRTTARVERYASILILPCSSLCLIALVICSSCHIVLRNVNRGEMLQLLAPIGFTVTSIMQHLILVSRCNLIARCIDHMRMDWARIDNENDRNVMTKNLRVGHNLTIVCAIFMYSGAVFSHVIKPLCSEKTLNEFNQTVGPLVFPGADIFFDLNAGFNYEIVFCSICIAGFINFSIFIAICNLASIFVTHVCGQIQIVVSKLQSLTDFDDNADVTVTVDNRIHCIVRLHVRVLRFSSRIDEILREICLLEVVTSTLFICFVAYYCLTEWNNSDHMAIIMYFLILLSLIFNIFIFCHIGELLKEQSTQVGRTASTIAWYKLPGKSALSLVLIIAVSSYPRRLTAGRIIELSIVTFGSIMRTSIVYLNMLRTVVDT